jgi:hypothetical protein
LIRNLETTVAMKKRNGRNETTAKRTAKRTITQMVKLRQHGCHI